ncbi:unnamed protein product [Ceutorhynchus assimilis]|uniref:Uncharacterized protein n=1 Tax=Ceutorhynchus assimilis TaxID=467358 RepID=A0A9N9MCK0_9CUCU|nr:unnamed protein product [Ceutorhynchus assimilis]
MDMEKKAEDLKVVYHSQHVRILKEDDEIWISSEDLNTENSSDDVDKTKTKNAYKKKLKLKTRKRSTPNIRLQRPSIPSVSSTSKDLDDRLLMPSTTDDLNSRSTDDSRTSDEEYHHPPVPSSECLSKRLSLEDWRPMKGALSASTLEDNASSTGETIKMARDSRNFFDAMFDKLKSLKRCPVLKSGEEKLDVDVDEKSFKYLKNTPQVRQQLDFINELNKEIEETLSLYKAERQQRLNTEMELYKNVSGTKLLDVEMPFLEMCQRDLEKFKMPFDGNEETKEYECDSEEIGAVEIHKDIENGLFNATNFIKKNICAARDGTMANFPLTNEEKIKIDELLKDIDNYELDDAELSLSTTSIPENDIEQEIDNDLNCFSLLEEEKKRISEIDNKLKKFTSEDEVDQKNLLPVKDERFWNLDFEQPLKDIDAKLEKLQDSDTKVDDQFRNDCEAYLKQLKEEFPEI